MTISSTTNRTVAATNGVTTVFPFGYKFLQNQDLVVLKTDISTAVVTTLVLDSDYTVTGAGDANGGSVTITPAIATGFKITIYRDPEATQELDLVPNDPLPAAAAEDGFDKLTMIVQRTRELTNRSFRLDDGDVSGASLVVPPLQASKFVRVASDGMGFEFSEVATGTVVSANETTQGIAEIATQTETDTGTDDVRIVTPKKLKNSALSTTVTAHTASIAANTAALANLRKAVSRRQTVLFGPMDANGLPSFGGATGATTVTASGTLVATGANGFDSNGEFNAVGSITNPAFTGLSTNGTMYGYLTVNNDGTCTAGTTTLAPVYQFGGTYSTTNGQFTFNTQAMVGTVGNGSAAVEVYRVYVGEFTVAGNVVTAIRWYAVGGRYRVTGQTVTFGATLTVNHNIGVRPRAVMALLQNISAEAGYATTDDPIIGWWLGQNSPSQGINPTAGTNTIALNQSSAIAVLDKAAHTFVNITPAKWNWIVEADRGW